MERFFTASVWVRPAERFRTGFGAVLGLLFVGVCGLWLHRQFHVPIALIAPLGASSVLLFAVPASPLAQPWSIVGGNLVAGLVSLFVGSLMPQPELAAALAVGLSIAAMASLRCLHPPSGAVALLAVMEAGKAADHGLGFLLWGVMANSVLLLLAAVLYHRLTGHLYPEFLRRPAQPSSTPAAQEAATARIVSEVLTDSDEILDISTEELRGLYDRISLRLAVTKHDALDCRALMLPMPEALSPDLSLTKAFDALLHQPQQAMLVTDDHARVIGLVTLSDFTAKAELGGESIRVALGQRLRNAARLRPAPNQIVRDIMQSEPLRSRPLTLLPKRSLP